MQSNWLIVLAALTGSLVLVTPSHADKVKAGSSTQSTKQTGSTKGIETTGGQSGGTKSAPFDPVTVTFPKSTNSGSQKAGDTSSRGTVKRR